MEQHGRNNRPARWKDRKDSQGRWSARLVRFAAVLAAIAALGLAGGFVYGAYAAFGGSVGDVLSNRASGAASGGTADGRVGTTLPSTPQTPSGQKPPHTASSPAFSPGKTVHIVALGDSLTHGFGDASGQGYVGDVSAQFRHNGNRVIQSNLGIDGLTSAGLVAQVKQPEVENLLASANLILISIGGNDLDKAAGLPNIDTRRITAADKQFNANLARILTQIRSVNKTGVIALIGLYNPYGDAAAVRKQTDAIVESWDQQEDQVVSGFPNAVVVQTFDLFELHPAAFLYADHFHPNQAGYQRIAERVWQDIQGG